MSKKNSRSTHYCKKLNPKKLLKTLQKEWKQQESKKD